MENKVEKNKQRIDKANICPKNMTQAYTSRYTTKGFYINMLETSACQSLLLYYSEQPKNGTSLTPTNRWIKKTDKYTQWTFIQP